MIASLPEETAEDLYENAPCGYLLVRNDGMLLQVNRTFLDWTGYARTDLLRCRCFPELLTVPGRIYYETHYAPLLQIQGFVKEVAFDLICADGKRLPILLNATVIANAEGDTTGSRITIFDATERRRYEQELLRTRRAAEQFRSRQDRIRQS